MPVKLPQRSKKVSNPATLTPALALAAFKKRIESANKQISVQGSQGNWNHNEYMFGMFNGMECVLATIEGREPAFRERPKTGFLNATLPKNFKPTVQGEEARPGRQIPFRS